MSATPYIAVGVGATPFTGTGAKTVLAAPIADLDDFDAADRFRVRHTALFLNNTGDPQELRYDLFGDAVQLHSLQFGSVSPDDDPRDIVIDYEIVALAGNTCRVTCEAWMSSAGSEASRGNGPAVRPRPAIWRAKAFVEPVTLDLRATIQTNSIGTHLLSPDETFVHKVEPVLSTTGSGENLVLSVRGESGSPQTGNVVITAADVGAADENLLGYPVAYDTDDARPDAPKVWWDTVDQPTIGDPAAAGDYWITDAVLP